MVDTPSGTNKKTVRSIFEDATHSDNLRSVILGSNALLLYSDEDRRRQTVSLVSEFLSRNASMEHAGLGYFPLGPRRTDHAVVRARHWRSTDRTRRCYGGF